MTKPTLYAFEITLHGLPAESAPGPTFTDASGTWPTLAVSKPALAVSMTAGFDDALAGLAELERMYAEPDGSFVWTSSRSSDAGAAWWQVDGNACEKDGRVLLVDLKGSCPPAEFDRLLAAFGWPAQPMMMLLVRSAVFLGEEAFRRHAMARGLLGDGETLRPS